ncbi:protein serine/threonine phosphatase [[Leptolyngbya] sp. PCC 7376]|uniref:serine/threonine phosphatase n=1 Tax=[Leptolyngbya] sp. PCC 7376 TaxID=111781 RepID=UPI00029F06E4|nr:serine/threonine phosphatase [[Leptolyngbya] sp. PCC 7376]AFY38681.1 protein serine/threonine phosphatase [[Leptolyngbya] sp. PCC 7376]
MITCPKCSQQNPLENRFCQYCGASLLVPCPHCEAQVKLEDMECHSCGGQLVPTLIGIVLEGDPEAFATATHLDMQQRYAIAPVSPEAQSVLGGIPVMDGQPEEFSYLEQVLEQEAENLQILVATDKDGLANPQLWLQMGIPAIARHYLSLQEMSFGFPLLRDAWMSADHHILLLDKRHDTVLVSDHLAQATPEYNQILQWTYQMVSMWRELEPLRCCQSLLKVNNLFIDEDHNLVIERLIEDDPLHFPNLKDLTDLWENLFHTSEASEFADLQTVIEQSVATNLTKSNDLMGAIKSLATGGSAGVATVIQSPSDIDFDENDDWVNREEFQEEDTDSTPDSETANDAETEEATITTAVDLDQMKYSSDGDEQPTVVLPMHLLNLEDAGLSDIGSQRDHNEDYFGIQTQIEKHENLLGKQVKARGLYVVCDGMGGHAAGEVASALSVESLQNYFQKHWQDQLPNEATIQEGVWQTNQKIYDINLNNARSGSGRMGTTLVMVLVQDNQAAIAHVGDSRIYRISRKWDLQQLTVDHEVGQREIQKGVEPDIAYGRADAYQLTQAIGPRDNTFVQPDVTFIDINEDSLFLLCSDGLSDNEFLEQYWEKYLLPLLSSRANLDQGVKELIELANEHNGHDNITAVLVRVKVRPNLSGNPVM